MDDDELTEDENDKPVENARIADPLPTKNPTPPFASN